MITTILFDLDGALIDTDPTAARTVTDCFSRWGTRVSHEDAAHVTGRTWASALEFLYRKYPPPLPLKDATDLIMRAYRENLEKELIVVPGSVDAVRALGRNHRLAVVSGSGRVEILWALTKLGIQDQFEVILGAEDYPRSKPEPDGYRKALTLLRADAKHSLVFEDSMAGIASARAAGLWVVAITATNHFQQDVSMAHEQIPNLTPVTPQWIRELSHRLGLGC